MKKRAQAVLASSVRPAQRLRRWPQRHHCPHDHFLTQCHRQVAPAQKLTIQTSCRVPGAVNCIVERGCVGSRGTNATLYGSPRSQVTWGAAMDDGSATEWITQLSWITRLTDIDVRSTDSTPAEDHDACSSRKAAILEDVGFRNI